MRWWCVNQLVKTIVVPVLQSVSALVGLIGNEVRAAAEPAFTLVQPAALVINGTHRSALTGCDRYREAVARAGDGDVAVVTVDELRSGAGTRDGQRAGNLVGRHEWAADVGSRGAVGSLAIEDLACGSLQCTQVTLHSGRFLARSRAAVQCHGTHDNDSHHGQAGNQLHERDAALVFHDRTLVGSVRELGGDLVKGHSGFLF